ncbi:hypothetical protein [Nonomuraea basaltis]|uniref:hypothetical protein n=1 Tax=Nonomuraea basaltis TaxID=2495887 RepID=UPI00110C57F5|nr:hypothetical protein [Nonomuraea basaltis]TMR97922.1 hypothetical protein EJK15_15575 [Nonomuraea basaltis]
MARFQCDVAIEALPRPWLEDFVHSLFDRAESLALDGDGWVEDVEELADVTLVEGEHLTAGARYQRHNARLDADGEVQDEGGTTTELVITSWNRRGEVSAEITTWLDDDEKITWTVRLRSPEKAEKASAGGTYQGHKRWRRLTWAIRFDAGQWWKAAEGRAWGRRDEPAMAMLRHPLAEAVLRIRPKTAGDRNWRVGVTLTVRGRSWARPVVAIFLPFVRRRLRNEFRKVVADVAKQWNEQIPGIRELDPRQAEIWFPVIQADREELDRWIAEQGNS